MNSDNENKISKANLRSPTNKNAKDNEEIKISKITFKSNSKINNYSHIKSKSDNESEFINYNIIKSARSRVQDKKSELKDNSTLKNINLLLATGTFFI